MLTIDAARGALARRIQILPVNAASAAARGPCSCAFWQSGGDASPIPGSAPGAPADHWL